MGALAAPVAQSRCGCAEACSPALPMVKLLPLPIFIFFLAFNYSAKRRTGKVKSTHAPDVPLWHWALGQGISFPGNPSAAFPAPCLAAHHWGPKTTSFPPELHHRPRCPPWLLPPGALASLPWPAMSLAALAEPRRPAPPCLCRESKRCTKSRLGQLVSVRVLRLVSLFLNGSAKLWGNFSFLFFFFSFPWPHEWSAPNCL